VELAIENFDFDSRLFLSEHASRVEQDHRDSLKANYMHHARLPGLRKAQAHLDEAQFRNSEGSLSWPPPDPATIATTNTHKQKEIHHYLYQN
jgi:hypothetical protein